MALSSAVSVVGMALSSVQSMASDFAAHKFAANKKSRELKTSQQKKKSRWPLAKMLSMLGKQQMGRAAQQYLAQIKSDARNTITVSLLLSGRGVSRGTRAHVVRARPAGSSVVQAFCPRARKGDARPIEKGYPAGSCTSLQAR